MGGRKSQNLELELRVSIHHWRFEDGNTCPNPGSQWQLEPPPRGWYCWVYPDNTKEFLAWMDKNCPTADCTPRFNSGDPMVTVFITDDKESTLFQLKWL